MSGPIKLLIVDDSAVVRQVLGAIFASDPALRVLASAADPLIARQRMAAEWPDVIVLDVEMPHMDGITFLKQIMALRPTRVLICSSLTEHGAATTLQALAAGAVGYVTKPKLGLKDFLSGSAAELIRSVKLAARTTPQAMPRAAASPPPPAPAPPALAVRDARRLVAIACSTGGTQALERILTALPEHSPGILVVQHMPEKFTAAFAARLDGLCAIEVREARSGDRVLAGCALIAPGGRHMRLMRHASPYVVEVLDGPPVNCHKPSADVMFHSVASAAGANAIGVVLTGMGDDGARGLRAMHDAGAHTLAQDEASCVVYGMPREAVRMGGVDQVIALDAIAAALVLFNR